MGMKAVILAGGEGRRLKAVTGELPKPMVPLLGKPLMERVIELLRKNGVTEIAATLRYNPAPILAYFGNGESMGVRLRWFIEQEPLGTAGSVKTASASPAVRTSWSSAGTPPVISTSPSSCASTAAGATRSR